MAPPSKQTRSYWKNRVLNFFDEAINPGFRKGLWADCPIHAIESDPSLGTIYYNEMYHANDANGDSIWTESGDVPLVAVADAANGQITLAATANTDNHACTIASFGESWLCASGKELWFEAGVTCTESAATLANLAIGLSDSPGANFLQDDGAGPPASHDGLVFFKVDGGAVWQFESSNAAAQDTNTDAGAFTSGTQQRVGFHFDGTATTGVITPYIDDVADDTVSVTLAALGEMELVASVKNGGAGGAVAIETLYIDYIKIVQLR